LLGLRHHDVDPLHGTVMVGRQPRRSLVEGRSWFPLTPGLEESGSPLRHHAATVIARDTDVTLRELMATLGRSSLVAALR
jgi:hypothetical protein